MGAAAETLRPVCGAEGCRAGASVELPFCRAHWRMLPPETRRAITRQWRIGYGTGELAATFQTAEAVRSARGFFGAAMDPLVKPEGDEKKGAARKIVAEAELAVRSARVIEAASADLLRRAESCVAALQGAPPANPRPAVAGRAG